ncbi:MAG: hypothetical protein V3T48_11890 [Vicinamibacterales bacterium]|jgi:hypothetical protein
MGLTCPSCGNEQSFQVKTLQMHVLHVDGEQVDLAEEGRPAVLELLCDECEAEIDLQGLDADIRREMLFTLGAQ